MEPLPLRDIHLPDPISWWPPAIGWWLLLGLVLLMSAGLVYGVRRWRRLTPARRALQALDRLESDSNMTVREKLQELSVLMKRVALSLNPRAAVAGLTGENWLRWLDETAGTVGFREGPGRRLAEAPYRPAPDATELAEVLEECRNWLKAQRQRGRPRA